MKNGKGIIKYLDGSTYEGDFLDNKMDGFGIYKWSEKTHQYEG